jgi:FixJ family two-component response regulator
MDRSGFFTLIDGDMLRRAAISHTLSAHGIHVEPYEDIAELIGRWPRSGLILAHDDGGTISALIEHMGHSGGWLPVVGFAERPSPKEIVAAILNGAVDYIAWPFDEAELAATLASARVRADSLGNAKLREARARGRIERLTRREREVLSCVASGLSSRLIGEKLAISPRTVEIHRANMLNKIGAHHTSEAIRIAIEAALVA